MRLGEGCGSRRRELNRGAKRLLRDFVLLEELGYLKWSPRRKDWRFGPEALAFMAKVRGDLDAARDRRKAKAEKAEAKLDAGRNRRPR
jgi:DNA-binding IclR family transcriptional regulator